MNTFSVKLWVNKQRIKKNGNVSLYIQIIVDKKHDEIPLNIEWPFDKIDLKKGELLPRQKKDPDHYEFSLIVNTEKHKFWNLAKTFRLQERDFTLDQLVAEARVYERRFSLVKYMENRIKQLKRSYDRAPETIKHYNTTKNRIMEFDPGVKIRQVDRIWLSKFAIFLSKRHKNSKNMIWSRIKDVKAFIEVADKEGLAINTDFRNYKNKKPEGKTVWLNEDELRRLIKLYQSGTLEGNMATCLQAFLFACFTGLRISDLQRMNSAWVVDNELRFIPKKTQKLQKEVVVPLIPLAVEFLKNTNMSFNLPSDQKFNVKLKTIAEKAKIDKNLSTKVARHTFGSQSAIAGIPLQVISKLMGHASIQTTMVYIHIADDIKRREMIKLQAAFGNILQPSAARTH